MANELQSRGRRLRCGIAGKLGELASVSHWGVCLPEVVSNGLLPRALSATAALICPIEHHGGRDEGDVTLHGALSSAKARAVAY